MNRGNIPGFYWDEEKKKYFKIQANHVAPVNAKYSESNVKLEQRETKKRRVEEKRDRQVRKQTVPTAKLLKSPLLGGAGLAREHGNRPFAYYRAQRNVALVNELQRQETRIGMEGFSPEELRLSDVLYLRERSKVLMAVSHGHACHAVYLQDAAPDVEWQGNQELTGGRAMHAFHDSIISLASSKDIVVAFTGQHNKFSGNTFIANLDAAEGMEDRFRFNVGLDSETLCDCKLASETNNLAFCTDVAIWTQSVTPSGPVSLNIFPSLGGFESFALDWLDRSTVAVGTRRSLPVQHEVLLCDIRSGGKASRLQRKDRITGVHSPNDSGTNLLVSSSRQISLYDMRVLRADAPLLSVDHLSGTTRLQTPTYGDILAATDKDNKIQTYSIRTGRHLRTFSAPADRGLLQRPRWEEDWRGSPYLQACAGNTIQRWKWQQSEP